MPAQPGSPGSRGSGSSASAPDATFSFELTRPNCSKDDGTANTIVLTAAGSFDNRGQVVASGAFDILSAAGAQVSGGVCKAPAFVNFTPFGGPNPGSQGGTLNITATLTPAGGTPVLNVAITVNCLINKPASFTGKEGVTVVGGVGNFADIVRGQLCFT